MFVPAHMCAGKANRLSIFDSANELVHLLDKPIQYIYGLYDL